MSNLTKSEDLENITETENIEYILNVKKNNIYYGLCDKIKIPNFSNKKIWLDVEKILGKNNVRNIQGIRLKQDDLINEVNKLNNMNKLLIIIIVILILLNLFTNKKLI